VASYRERKERYLEKHPGASIAEARGHGKTPERPHLGKTQERFAEYHGRREAAERHVNELKEQKFSNEPNYNAESSAYSTSRIPLSELEKSAGYDTLDDYVDDAGGWDEVDDGYGYYH
jgi:hypothetical protein